MPLDIDVIPARAGLDQVTVYWHDLEPGKGQITLLCYGSAWTAWWGSMGDRGVKQFFAGCDLGYLQNRFGQSQVLKQNNVTASWLRKILAAVREHLAQNATPVLAPTPVLPEPFRTVVREGLNAAVTAVLEQTAAPAQTTPTPAADPGLFVVRLYDGFDHEWMDVSKAVPQEEADRIWKGHTNNGTEKTTFQDIDYYKVFPADTRMLCRSEVDYE